MDAKELGQQPAYPTPELQGSGGNYVTVSIGGLTKREAFAKAALGPLCRLIPSNPAVSRQDAVWIAQAAVLCADAMLAELAKDQP